MRMTIFLQGKLKRKVSYTAFGRRAAALNVPRGAPGSARAAADTAAVDSVWHDNPRGVRVQLRNRTRDDRVAEREPARAMLPSRSRDVAESVRMPLLELNQLAGPPLPTRRWRLVDGLAIGRGPANGLVLPDPAVSREHALIRADGAHWSLLDRHSRLGTRLNGLVLAPGAPADLHVGDVVGLGPWRFRIDVVESAPLRDAEPSGSLAEQRLELLLGCA